MSAELHVATTGSDHADGSEDRPLRTINRAAALAQPGDTVVVHGGSTASGCSRGGAGSATGVASPTPPPPASTS